MLDQMGDAEGDDARLPAARAGQDEHRAVGGLDSFTLLRVELGEERQSRDSILLGNAEEVPFLRDSLVMFFLPGTSVPGSHISPLRWGVVRECSICVRIG